MTAALRRRVARPVGLALALAVGLAGCGHDRADSLVGVAEASGAGAATTLSPGAGRSLVGPWKRAGRPPYRSSVRAVDDATASRMRASHRPGCPVELRDLRLVTVTHLDLGGRSRTGELVVHATLAAGVARVFRTLYDAGFPVAQVRLVDEYGGDDDRSMAANNTSAYNCRAVTGGTGWSEHAYGRAIDVNPVQNPYVRGSTVAPPAGRSYLDRSDLRPGMAEGVLVRAFAVEGWRWGGAWAGSRDYQHFSTTGR